MAKSFLGICDARLLHESNERSVDIHEVWDVYTCACVISVFFIDDWPEMLDSRSYNASISRIMAPFAGGVCDEWTGNGNYEREKCLHVGAIISSCYEHDNSYFSIDAAPARWRWAIETSENGVLAILALRPAHIAPVTRGMASSWSMKIAALL